MGSINVLLFGETGVGKSSVLNLIAGRQVAGGVSSERTASPKQYSFAIGGHQFRIWDTDGLEDPEMAVNLNDYLAAIEKNIELIQQLSQEGGINLLLFCINGQTATGANSLSSYRLFYEVLCGSNVPIALVVTHLEKEPYMEDWWSQNSKSLERNGIRSAGHACVTGLPGHSKYEDSKVAIENLLVGCDVEGRYIMPSEAWFTQFMRPFGMFSPPKDLRGKKLVDTLTKRCRLDPKVAQSIAEKLERRT